MAIIGIVAVAENLAIGKGGKLPWHYPADLKHFKQTTTGNAIVMGSNTWRSIGKPLSNRLNIVLSRRAQLDSDDNLLFLRNVSEAADLTKFLNGEFAHSPLLQLYPTCESLRSFDIAQRSYGSP